MVKDEERQGWRASKIVGDDEGELKSDDLYSIKDLTWHSLGNLRCIQLWYGNNMRIISNDKNNQYNIFWKVQEGIIGKISSILGAGLVDSYRQYIHNYHR